MPSLSPLWKFLESRPRPVAVLAEWRYRLSDAFEIVRPLLRATGGSATSYPNADPRGLPLRVVRHRNGAIVAVDQESEGTRVELEETDLAVFGIALRDLRTTVAEALGLTVSRAPLDGKPTMVPIGHWEPKPAASFPVVLVCCTGPRQARDIIHPMVEAAKKPTLILTPTRDRWPDGLSEYCQKQKCLLVPLDEVLDLEGSCLVAADAWGSHLAAFRHYADLTLPANFSNKRPMPVRGPRAAKIEKLEKEMEAHLIAARDKAHSLNDQGLEPILLPRPKQKELAERTGLSKSDVCRCLNDPRAKVLKMLWRAAESVDGVMSFKRRH